MASDQALVEGRAALHIRWLCINWERSPFEHLGQVTGLWGASAGFRRRVVRRWRERPRLTSPK